MPRRLLRYAVVAAALLVILTAACSTGGGEWSSPTQAPDPAPTGLHIPAINVHADQVMDLAVDDSGEVEVPPVEDPMRLGWYAPGVAPGQLGPHIMLGHVNGGGQDGVFARIDELQPGAHISVPSGTATHHYTVDRVETVPKAEFPTADVYGDTAGPTLRLITCGGTWDPAANSYESQIIVYATGT